MSAPTDEDFLYEVWRTQKMLCAAYARTSEMIGDTEGEVYAFCRAKADEPDRREQIERIQDRYRADKLSAFRTLPVRPSKRRPDPPRGHDHPILGWQPEAPTPLLGANSQVALQAAMATKGPAGDGTNQHPEFTALKAERNKQMALDEADRDWSEYDRLAKELAG